MDFPPRRETPVRRRPSTEEPAAPEDGAAAPTLRAEVAAPPERPVSPPPGPRRPRRRASETIARILWAIPWIVVAVVIIVVGELPFALVMIALACVGLHEFFTMAERARPFPIVGFAAAAALVLAARYGSSFQLVLVLVAVFPAMFAFAVTRDSRANVTYSMAVTLFGIVWIAVPFAHAVLLRDLPLHGAALLVDVLIATFLADTAAYVGGRLFGRTPLAPTLSPNKTVEGLVAGFVGGTLGFWFAGLYQDWLSGTEALLIGACVAAVAPIGDLFESMVKRDLGVKDSGRLFGPHGGVLDRLDAVLFTVVIGYYLSVAVVF